MSKEFPYEDAYSLVRRVTLQYQPFLRRGDKKTQCVNVREATELFKADQGLEENSKLDYAQSMFGGKVRNSIIRRGRVTVFAGIHGASCQSLLLRLMNENLNIGNAILWLTSGNGVVASLGLLMCDREIMVNGRPDNASMDRSGISLPGNYFKNMPFIISPEINLDPGWLGEQLMVFEGYENTLLVIDDLDVFFDSWNAAARKQGHGIDSEEDLGRYLSALAEIQDIAIVAGIGTKYGEEACALSNIRGFMAISTYADCLCSVKLADGFPRSSQKFRFNVKKNLFGERFSFLMDVFDTRYGASFLG